MPVTGVDQVTRHLPWGWLRECRAVSTGWDKRAVCSSTKETEWGHRHPAPTLLPVTSAVNSSAPSSVPSLAYFLSFSILLGPLLLYLLLLCVLSQLATQMLPTQEDGPWSLRWLVRPGN
jgi:hypothetical protein